MLLKLSNEKTRTSKKKSPTFLTNLPNPENPFTNSRKTNVPLMLNETNFKLLLKKLKLLLNLKNLRSSDSKSKLHKLSKTSSDELPKKTKKSTTLDETDNELLNLCKLPSTLKSELVVKQSESRRRWNLT